MRTYLDYKAKKVVFGEVNYPKLLTKISKPAKQIYYRGNLQGDILDKTIAIVGTRMMTNYGKQVIDEFVSYFVANGVTTISGFMYGVDTEVHNKTIEYGGRTVSIFGNGLDYIYPPENEKLYTGILENSGVVISEYKLDAKPQLWTYPARNRIVAALATIGVLIVEADVESGSLITARLARLQEKNVWAVPGPITSKTSRGTNFLIKKGYAKMATVPQDIFKRGKERIQKAPSGLIGLEAEIYAVLERESLSVDEIARKLNKDIVGISGSLTLMGIRGVIGEVGGKFFISKM